MKSTLLYLFFFSIAISSFAQVNKTIVTADDFSGIDSLLNQVLKDQHVAGFAVAVVKGDKVIYSKGFGYRDVANKKPVTPNTLFAIGSSTKAFTASLLGLLEKEGKLTFEDKATDHLPQLRFYTEEMNSQITLRDLMAHRTGISRYDHSWILFNTANRDSIINRVKYMKPTAAVRQKWLYNNFMYLAQGMVVEKISGKTWEQNIQEKFFVPLEMTRSNTSIKALEADSNAALPYVTAKGGVIKKIDYYNINGMEPAGSINSSVNEMANWLKVWISGGSYNNKEILPSDYVREAASSQMVITPALPGKHGDVYLANYGLGWMISSYRGHYMVEHGGNINGFSASAAFYPTDRIGIVVLTNQNSSVVPGVVRNSIADRIFKLKKIDWNGDAKAAATAAAKNEEEVSRNKKKQAILNTSPSHPLKDYVGSFENPAYGSIKVSLDKDRLYAMAGDNKVLLKHLHYDVFEPKSINKDGVVDTAEVKIGFNFLGDQMGKIQRIAIQFEGEAAPVEFNFKPELKVLPLQELERYTGDYSLGEMTVKVFLKGTTLVVFVPGQPEYETVATGDATFVLKMLKDYSVKFESAGDKKANSMTFIQPNGSFKAQRKK